MRHDVVEIVSGHESVVVQVSLSENVLDLIVSQVLSQFLGDFLQLKGGESSSFVNIECLEYLVDFGSAFFVTEFGGSQSQKFCEVNTSRLIIIEFSKNLINEFVLSSKTKVFEGSF